MSVRDGRKEEKEEENRIWEKWSTQGDGKQRASLASEELPEYHHLSLSTVSGFGKSWE